MTLTRRTVLQLSVLAAGALFGSSTADARKVPPRQVELWYGTELAKPEPGSFTVMRWGNHPSHARPVERVTPVKLEIVSTTNDNSKFALHAVLPYRADPLSLDGRNPLARYFLRANNKWWWPTGGGRTKGADLVTFELDHDGAFVVGQRLNIPVQKRQPLDTHVGFAWSVQPTGALTSPIEIELRVDNHGSGAVATSLRPHMFHVELRHADGTRAPQRNPRRSTNNKAEAVLAPGDATSFTADLHDYLIIDRPGTYHVTMTYTGALTDGTGIRAARWDVTRTSIATIVIK